MRRSNFSEQKLVVVLFIMVLVTFFLAQADTPKIEKMYININPAVTTSLDQNINPGGVPGINEIDQFIPAVELR